MIKYLYILYSILILVVSVSGVPVLDVFSSSYHKVAVFILGMSIFPALIVTMFNVVAYYEEKQDTKSDFAQFYLRTAVGMKLLSRWPVVVWYLWGALLLQANMLLMSCAVFSLAIAASSVVWVHNALYTNFISDSLKGK